MQSTGSFNTFHLYQLLASENGERFFLSLANSFLSKNKDVEKFLKQNAVQSCRLRTSSTYLIVRDLGSDFELSGYFTLALKMLTVKLDALTSTNRKLLKNFGYIDEDSYSLKLPAVLIAQFGKNFNNLSISGDKLMSIALENARNIFSLSSGKLVFLECEPEPKIVSFYERNGFKLLDKRVTTEEKELLQMYRII